MRAAKTLSTSSDIGTVVGSEAAVFDRTDGLSFQLIESSDAFVAIAQEWDRLASFGQGLSSFFSSSSYLLSGLSSSVPSNVRHVIAIAYDNEELVAGIALDVCQRFGLRKATWLGGPVANYGDIVSRSDTDLEALLSYLGDNGVCDWLELDGLPEDFPVSRCTVRRDVFHCAMDLSRLENEEGYYRSLRSSTRKSRRRNRKKFNQLGNVRFQIVEDAELIRSQLPELFEMKKKQLDAQGLIGRNLRQHDFSTLVHDLCCGKVSSGSRPIYSIVSLDGKPVAVELGFLRKDHYWSFMGSFDLEARTHGVGTIQMEDTLFWCMENGVKTFDLLPPDDPYKTSWPSEKYARFDCTIPLNSVGLIASRMQIYSAHKLAKTAFNALPTGLRKRILSVLVR